MVIIITGPSSTGKTFIANQLMEELEIPFFSMDWLKMGLYRSNPNIGFTPTDNKKTEEFLRPVIVEMIKTIQENQQSLIIEGIYVTNELLSQLDNVLVVNMKFSEQYIINSYVDIIKHRSVSELRQYDEERTVADFIKEHKEFVLDGAYEFVVERDYLNKVDKIVEFVKEQVRK